LIGNTKLISVTQQAAFTVEQVGLRMNRPSLPQIDLGDSNGRFNRARMNEFQSILLPQVITADAFNSGKGMDIDLKPFGFERPNVCGCTIEVRERFPDLDYRFAAPLAEPFWDEWSRGRCHRRNDGGYL
jgi:hypothetical protein